jgi:CRP-like cAMP-binding protein
MRENEQVDTFYVLVDGEAEVSLQGKPISVLKPGSCFGEILYFADSVERRTTTVTVRTRLTAVQIKAGALRVATPSCQVGFNKAFMRVLVERLALANRQLAQR